MRRSSGNPWNLAWRIPEPVILPAVTALLLIGAVFVVLAWDGARTAVDTAAQLDAARADRNARAVGMELARRQDQLAELVQNERLEVSARARVSEVLDRALLDNEALAYVAVSGNGNPIATSEQSVGSVAAWGVSDDINSFGRVVAARNEPRTSGRFEAGDRTLFAVGVPMPAGSGERGAVVLTLDVGRGAFGAFYPTAQDDESGDIGTIALRDDRDRLVAGSEVDGAERVMRSVPNSGWRLVVSRTEPEETLLPVWAYPLFAALLLMLSVVLTVQEVNRRRYQEIGSERTKQVRSLYELASGMLHTTTQSEQAEQLANGVNELVDADAVQVTVADMGAGQSPVVVGTPSEDQRAYRVAITGTHGPLGELVVRRTDDEFDEEERSVVQTAAALAGAAFNTAATIETERAAAAELQRLDELRSNLIATVAHELRTPVTAVKGVLGLLSMQDDLSDKSNEYVNVATERTDRLVALIQDLFDCSLLETGQLDIRPKRELASELLESALGAQAAARPGELVLSATENLPITVDPVRFDQLVNNLVTNAFRHGKAPVEVSVRPSDAGVVVVVSDEGPGIPSEDRDRIFGKFWQGSTGHARLVEGAGIGLSLVQGLVALHGGTIAIDAAHADGRGARFTIWLPDVVPDQPASSVR